MLSDRGDLLCWKKWLKEKQRQNSCLIFEGVPLAEQGSISIFFRREMIFEEDTVANLRILPALEAGSHADGKIKFQF